MSKSTEGLYDAVVKGVDLLLSALKEECKSNKRLDNAVARIERMSKTIPTFRAKYTRIAGETGKPSKPDAAKGKAAAAAPAKGKGKAAAAAPAKGKAAPAKGKAAKGKAAAPAPAKGKAAKGRAAAPAPAEGAPAPEPTAPGSDTTQ